MDYDYKGMSLNKKWRLNLSAILLRYHKILKEVI